MAGGKLTKRPTQFQRAADGQMTLFEHLRELRGRLFKATLGVLVGMILGLVVASRATKFLIAPYCNLHAQLQCTFSASGPLDAFLVNLKVALYVGLLVSAPIWLYQLWAFIAPGLHRRERRYTYTFAAIAAPLFAAGVILAHLIVSKSLHFLLGSTSFVVLVGIDGYFSFVTNLMLLFGVAFEFPLLILMLNMVGMVSGKRLLGWWRPAIFLMFLFGAIVTPTPDPFGMSILAACMGLLYFGAVGVALINDRRKGRNQRYAHLDDDATSALDFDDPEGIEPGDKISVSDTVAPAAPLERRYDDFT